LPPKLSIRIFASNATVSAGEWVRFYLYYSNDGSQNAGNVTLNSVIDGGCFDVVGQTIPLGSLAPGAAGSRSFDAQARSGGTCTNTATISSNSQPFDTDAVTVVVAP
jgi:uncharacterized repeat protein (TIGR01451 family)